MLKITVFLLTLLSISINLHAWGKRGHWIVGHQASRLLKKQDPKSAMAHLYLKNSLFVAHHSNSPDMIWKDSNSHPKWAKTNFGTHFIDVEHLLGPIPNSNKTAYFNRIRNFPQNFKELKEKYNNYVSPITNKKLKLKKDVGVAPWYIKQNFNSLVATFKCLKTKNIKFKMYPKYKLPISQNKNNKFTCSKNIKAYNVLFASFVYSSIISHYIADLAVPYHNSIDYDGYNTGNGGIHSYWESQIVDELGEGLENLVFEKIKTESFSKHIKKNILSKDSVIQTVFNLSADSLKNLNTVLILDNKYAVIKKGLKKSRAKRKPANTPEILNANKELIINRLATASVVLSSIFKKAYFEGGSPSLEKVKYINSFPFHKEVPFIWPEF